jgi:parvulin-like peptidyl-prolyl isomerase
MAIKSKERRAKSEELRAKCKELRARNKIAKSKRAMSKEQKIKSSRLLDKNKGYETLSSMLLALCCLLVLVGGCASLQQQENALAVVNGEPITERDLKYSLEIAHRREDLSSAKELNLSQFVQKLVDDKLVIQEARRMGAEDYPEIQQAVQAYILRESVVRLHDEEIVRKVTVTEEEIKNYYKKNYGRLSLGIIEVGSEENAREIIEQLKNRADFKELAQKYSKHPSQKDGGEVILRRNSLTPPIEKAVSNLKPGEFSDVLKINDRYYIVKFIGSEEAPDKELASVRGSIERAIRKQKEKERSDEYLKYLREQAKIHIDNELLQAINISEESEREKLSQDDRTLVQINGITLTAGNFISLARTYPGRSKETILNDWIDQKVVDREALSRHYERIPELENMVTRYKNQLLKNAFIKRVVIPQITLSDEALKKYYVSHQESFMKPTQVKILQITVKTLDDAQTILNNLQNGADFSWLAKNRSVDSVASEGGDLGWMTRAELPEPVRKIIDTLKPGDISPVVKIDSQYRIIQLLDRKEGEVEDFDKVKPAVYRAAFEEQANTLLNNYVAQLKKDAAITVNDEAVRLLEEKVQK